MNRINSFRDLKIWNLGIEIVESVYKVSKGFPKGELFGLQAQMRRSAVSIPSNIAEGFGRLSKKEYKHFLFISRGSAAELETQLEIAVRLKIIKRDQYRMFLEQLNHLNRMLINLIKRL